MSNRFALLVLTAMASIFAAIGTRAQHPIFKGGVDLVNVTATVTDGDGRFVSGLTRDDFVVTDNGRPQEIVSFSSERVPVSLGMLLDVSASMSEDRLATARSAINRFIFDLLGRDDELLLLEFTTRGRLLQTWTRDRDAFSRALERTNNLTMPPGTAVFDAVNAALRLAEEGVHQKKALLILSDGADNSSQMTVKKVQESIRKSEILVYALAVDGGDDGEDVDAGALRKLTENTGGRTEVVKGFKNLDRATARLADELNRQYVLGYTAPTVRDGKWHEIRVEARKRGAKVRARPGYIAS